MFQINVTGIIKTYISHPITCIFRKSCSLSDNVERHCRACQTTDGIMAHMLCMLD